MRTCHYGRFSVGAPSVIIHTLTFLPPSVVGLRCPVFSSTQYNTNPSYGRRSRFVRCIHKKQLIASHTTGKSSPDPISEYANPSPQDTDSTQNDKSDLQPAQTGSNEFSALPLVLLRNLVQIHRTLLIEKNPMGAFGNPFTSGDNGSEDKKTDDGVRPELQSLFQFILQLKPSPPILFNVKSDQIQVMDEQCHRNSDKNPKYKTGELIQNLARQTLEEDLDTSNDLEFRNLKSDHDDVPDDYGSILEVPKSPLFDPVTAVVLAGYSFRAYLNPPASAYHEVLTTLVDIPTSSKDERLERVITTHFHYPHAPVIASAAIGVFTLSIKLQELSDMNNSHIDDKNETEHNNDQSLSKEAQKDPDKNDMPFLTATINSVMVTACQDLSCAASILRVRSEMQYERKIDDQLRVSLYISRRAFERGAPPSHKAIISLKNLVETAIFEEELQTIEIPNMSFIPIEETERQAEFFQTSILPRDIQLPSLPFSLSKPESFMVSSDTLNKVRIALNVTFVPFLPEKPNMSMANNINDISPQDNIDAAASIDKNRDKKVDTGRVGCTMKEFEHAAKSLAELSLDAEPLSEEEATAAVLSVSETDDAKSLPIDEDKSSNTTASPKFFGSMLPRLELQLQLPNPVEALAAYLKSSTRLPLPSEWAHLSRSCRTIMEAMSDLILVERCSSVCEGAPTSLFVECHATDTQVSLFRDDENRALVIAFRGTDQMSWRDMLTDAQLFLQLWTPGDNISLEISLERTVGLPSFLPEPLRGKTKSPIAADASAVHYGFLQAYLSVREALRHAVSVLTRGDLQNYMLHFTGHSLGGALATIAAADFQAIYQTVGLQICCMTYGAPKVGNANFAHKFNKLVPNAFRIVNDLDVIARMPQSVSAEQSLSRYRHAGRTVLMNDVGELWVEGIHNDILEDEEWTWRDGKEALQELLTFEFKSWSEFFSSKAVKQHLVRRLTFLRTWLNYHPRLHIMRN